MWRLFTAWDTACAKPMNKLWVRLTFAFLLITWISLAAMAVVIQIAMATGFQQYIDRRAQGEFAPEQVERLQAFYAAAGSWDGAEALLASGRGFGRGAPLSIADPAGVVVSSTDPQLRQQVLSEDMLSRGVPLVVDGQTVGVLYRHSPGTQALGEAETAFLNTAGQTLLLTGIGLSLAAVIGGVGLARALTLPLKHLTREILQFPAGQQGRQVQVQGTEEIAALASAFNEMSAQLAALEAGRQRMAADIAHELRTPVSVLRGHLDAMRDGIFPMDQEHLAVAVDQTLVLGRLIDDLRLLTLAEARHLPLQRTSLLLTQFIQEIVESFRPLAYDADVLLKLDMPLQPLYVLADATRLRQVCGNLLANALHHTPAGGNIAVVLAPVGVTARLSVSNSGKPLTAEEMEHVFQPFWRAETTRQRDAAGSGLGLAIARQLVELHQGEVGVEAGANQMCFWFTLPLQIPEHTSDPRKQNRDA